MSKQKTVQLSFDTTVTVEVDADEARELELDTPQAVREFAETFEGVGVDSAYGRAWLVFVDAEKAVRLS